MDARTRLTKNNSYYDRFVSEVGVRSEARDFSKALDLFLSAVSPGKTILDIGSGSGTHLAEFQKLGFTALGIEPSRKMRELCGNRGLPVIDGAFENLVSLELPDAGGIWCAASLLHLPQNELPSTLRNIAGLLPPGAPFYFTVRLGEGAKWDQYDDQESGIARFIQLYKEQDLLKELSLLPFDVLESWVEDSTWGRPSKWISVVALKRR